MARDRNTLESFSSWIEKHSRALQRSRLWLPSGIIWQMVKINWHTYLEDYNCALDAMGEHESSQNIMDILSEGDFSFNLNLFQPKKKC